MAATAVSTLQTYLRFYQKSAIDFWEHLTPAQYGWLLIGVLVAGYLMMKSSR